jgi:hypothetical protein
MPVLFSQSKLFTLIVDIWKAMLLYNVRLDVLLFRYLIFTYMCPLLFCTFLYELYTYFRYVQYIYVWQILHISVLYA